jgi:hypothetical protein
MQFFKFLISILSNILFFTSFSTKGGGGGGVGVGADLPHLLENCIICPLMVITWRLSSRLFLVLQTKIPNLLVLTVLKSTKTGIIKAQLHYFPQSIIYLIDCVATFLFGWNKKTNKNTID